MSQEVTEFKIELDDFAQRFIINRGYLYNKSFTLIDNPEAIFQVYVQYGHVYLRCMGIGNNQTINIAIKFKMEVNGKKLKECVQKRVFTVYDQYSESFLTKFELSDMIKTMIGKSVIICFKIGDSISDFYEMNSDANAFMENIRKLYLERGFDLIVKAGGKDFNACRAALSKHSEVFKSMISFSSLTVSKNNIIKIENINAVNAKALVDWMHFCNIDNMDAIACSLYKAVRTYRIDRLMKACVQAMCKGLNANNIHERTVLAYTYDIEALKDSIRNFFNKSRTNMHMLMSTDEWFDFVYEDSEMASKISDDLIHNVRCT